MSEFAQRIDSLTIDDLRRGGSIKWNAYPDAIGAWIAEMDFGLAPVIVETLDDIRDRHLTGYVPLDWRTDIKSATVEFLQSHYNWESVRTRHIHVMPDVLTSFSLVMTHWLQPGSKIIVPTPCYMPFVDMPAAYGHQLVQLPMLHDDDGWHMDLDGLDREFAAGGALLVLCNPHNPIGKAYTRDELVQIRDVVAHHSGLVFSDEIHAPVRYGVDHIPYASIDQVTAQHTVTAMSASKAYNIAGLKCSQLVLSNEDDAKFINEIGHGFPYEATPLGIAANIAAFRHGQPWLDEVLQYLHGNWTTAMSMISELMPAVQVDAPEATFMLWLDVRELGLDDPRKHFLAHGVALTDGAECGDVGRQHVRFNFAMPRPVVIEAIERMAGSLA